MKKSSALSAESPEQLVANLRSLLADAEKSLGEGLVEGGESKLEALRERLVSARETAEHLFSSAKEKVVAGAKQTDSAIRSHPYESLAIALGVGVLLGAFLRRNK